MNFLSLKKYDNFILSKFENKNLRYFLLMLPQRLLCIFIIIILILTKLVSVSFIALIFLGFFLLKVKPFIIK